MTLSSTLLEVIDMMGTSRDMARLLIMAADSLHGAQKAAIAFAADQILSNLEEVDDDLQEIIKVLDDDERIKAAPPMARAA